MRVPRSGLLIATAAIVLSSGGIGYAAAKITSAQIKDNTIQSRDIRDGAIAARDLAADARTAGPKGDTGPAGPAGPSESWLARSNATAAATSVTTALAQVTSVPAGTYTVLARTTLVNNAGGTRGADCSISRDTVAVDTASIYAIPSGAGQNFSLPTVITLAAPATIKFGCEIAGGAGTAEGTRLLIMKVGVATVTGP